MKDFRKKIRQKIRRQVNNAWKTYLMKTARINPAPIIVLGHQKTGTSAIAALLGEATSKSVTIDIFHRVKRPFFLEELFEALVKFELLALS